MAEAPLARRRGGRAHRAAALAGAAALAAALATGCASGTKDHGAARVAATAATVMPASVPDRLSIPDIGVDAELGTVGLDAQGVMQTPPMDQPMRADWYKEGPTPGEKGPAAIAGHMDTPDVPKAVFYDLKDLKKNEQVKVHREDGSTAVFAVDEVDTFKKDKFPTDKVYGKTDKAELRLITCGGELTASRHWDSNVVVFAHLTGKAW
ncbi:class F sortase [Streptomyces monticola]|uniref:Class F sortase n=1 Tax=Streptomyces monticola TaxID=2666263 RepID=A0ABW2JM06_9ACTN